MADRPTNAAAIYRASYDDYEDSFYSSELSNSTPQKTWDTACGVYVSDPSAEA